MTKIFTAFILLVLSFQAVSQCDVPAYLWEAYEQDVKYLAIKRMQEVNSPDRHLVTIPQTWQDSIIEGMAAILHDSSIPEPDSVFNKYCVHDRVGNPVMKSFLIGVEEGTPMEEAWSQGHIVTGDTIVDELLSRYAFELVNHTSIYTEFATPYLLNTLALGDSLVNHVEGITFAEPNYLIGVAGRIHYTVDENGNRFYDFYFEWNDCFDGCDNYHAWQFMVDPDCNVTYLGFEDFGFFGIEPLPDPINCNLTSSDETLVDKQVGLHVFPNPGPGIYSLEINGAKVPLYASVYDITGRLVYSQLIHAATTQIDISPMENGIYVLHLELEDGFVSRRLVKQ